MRARLVNSKIVEVKNDNKVINRDPHAQAGNGWYQVERATYSLKKWERVSLSYRFYKTTNTVKEVAKITDIGLDAYKELVFEQIKNSTRDLVLSSYTLPQLGTIETNDDVSGFVIGAFQSLNDVGNAIQSATSYEEVEQVSGGVYNGY